MSSSTRTLRTSGAGAALVVLALVIAPFLGCGAPAGAAQPHEAVAAGTLDGRSRLTVTLPGEAGAPSAPATVTAGGQQLPARLTPMLSDRTATVVVVDASEAAAPVLQAGLSGAASLVLSAPPAARSALVADTDPPAVVAPLGTGPAGTLRGLAELRPGGQPRPADALDLALQQFAPGADDPRLVVLYTAAPDAAGLPVADLAARLTAAGAVLAVVGPGAVPPYWSAVAAATGGPAVAADGTGVVGAFDRLTVDLRTRYLVTFPAPAVLPATAVVRVDTPQGAVTADAVVPPISATPASASSAGGGAGRVVGVVAGSLVVLALLTVVAVAGIRTARRPAAGGRTAAARREAMTAWRMPGRVEPVAPRERLLGTMREAVRAGRPAVLRPVGGAAGLGATTAMVEFAHRWRDDHDIAWFVPAADPPLVADRLAELSEALGLAAPTDPAEVATDRLLAALRRRDRWLLVLDDAASPRQLARFLPGGPGHVLVASDDPEWEQHATPVSVGSFGRDESASVLRARRPGLSSAETDRLATALDDVPQAVDVAAATLAETGMSVGAYLRLLAEHPDRGGTTAACAVALDRLAADEPAALALLALLARLAPDPVPLSLLGGPPDVLPAPLTGIADPARLAHLVGVAQRRALVRADTGTVQLHPTPAGLLVVRGGEDGSGDGWAATAVRLLRAAFPDDGTAPDEPAGRGTWRALLPHVLAATDPTRPLDDVLVEVAWLLHRAATHLRVRGEPRAARSLAEDAYEAYHRRLGPDHPDTRAAARMLADLKAA